MVPGRIRDSECRERQHSSKLQEGARPPEGHQDGTHNPGDYGQRHRAQRQLDRSPTSAVTADPTRLKGRLCKNPVPVRIRNPFGFFSSTCLDVLKTGNLQMARASAFTVLVFAERLRSFGVRSETKSIWHIPFFSSRNLVIVVALSFAVQVWRQHNATLGGFLRTPFTPLRDCFVFVAIVFIPVLVLERVKAARGAWIISSSAQTGRYSILPRRVHLSRVEISESVSWMTAGGSRMLKFSLLL